MFLVWCCDVWWFWFDLVLEDMFLYFLVLVDFVFLVGNSQFWWLVYVYSVECCQVIIEIYEVENRFVVECYGGE